MARTKTEEALEPAGTVSMLIPLSEVLIEEPEEAFELEMEIIRINDKNPLPKYKVEGAVGMDVYANLKEDVIVGPNDQGIIPCGISVNIPEGWEIQLRGRSGLAYNSGIIAHFGTIDPGYLDEIQIIFWNLSRKALVVKNGDRIGQIVLQQVPRIKWIEVDNFGDSYNRGGGFGSSGV